MASFSLNTCTQPGTPLISDFVDHGSVEQLTQWRYVIYVTLR